MDLKNNNVHPEGWEEGRLPNKLNMMSFKACLAIIRPIVGGLVPRSVIKWQKHREGKI